MEGLEKKGLRMSLSKTKQMVGVERHNTVDSKLVIVMPQPRGH